MPAELLAEAIALLEDWNNPSAWRLRRKDTRRFLHKARVGISPQIRVAVEQCHRNRARRERALAARPKKKEGV